MSSKVHVHTYGVSDDEQRTSDSVTFFAANDAPTDLAQTSTIGNARTTVVDTIAASVDEDGYDSIGYLESDIVNIFNKCVSLGVCKNHEADLNTLLLKLEHSEDVYIADLCNSTHRKMWWNESTPLMIACLEGGATLVKVLLLLGADVCATNDLKSTALMIAAEGGRLDMLKDILDFSVHEPGGCFFCGPPKSPTVVTDIRNTAKVKQKMLLAMKNKYGQTALMLAIEGNRSKEALYLLSLDLSQLEHRNKYNKTPLFIAIEGGNYTIARHIIDLVLSGQTLTAFNDIKIGHNGNTPLMFACMAKDKGHIKILKYLLKAVPNIDVNATNNMNDSCFAWTLTSGNVAAMKAILAHKQFNFSEQRIENALKILCQNGHEECVLLILNHINAVKISRDLKLRILGDAWKYGMVRLATLHLMTNSNNCVNGTYWDMLDSPLDAVFNDDNADDQSGDQQKREQGDQDTSKNASFLLSTRMLSCKTDNSLKLLVQFAALYKFHFDYLIKYLSVQKNSIAILNDYLPLFLRCLKMGMNKEFDLKKNASKDNKLGLHGMYSPQEIRSMGLSYKYNYYPKHLTDVDAVKKIVRITIFLKERSSNLHEKIDTEAHLRLLEGMLLKIFNCRAFTSYKTLEKFQKPHHFQHSIVRVAHVFHSGPMAELFDHQISSIINSGNISPIVDELFWGFLRNKHYYTGTEKRLHILRKFRKAQLALHILGFSKLIDLPNSKRNIAELTSNLINIRFNPASMFCLEGLSKAIYLTLLVMQAISRKEHFSFDFAIIVMMSGTMLNELGEYQGDLIFPTFSISLLKKYFQSKWNCLDIIGLLLNFAGIFVESQNDDSPLPKALHSIAIIAVSLAMLRYISVYEPLGQLVEMVFAQLIDIVKFFVVFILATFGFFIAIFSLAHSQPNERFRTKSLTIDTLFHSAFANYDPFDIMFPDHSNPYRKLSMILFMLYVMFSGVVLLNLVIARMSATHDKLDAVALEQWKFNRAKIVKSYLLLNERSPYSMLPPPFNIISTVVALVTSLPRFFWFRWRLSKDKTLCDGLVITSIAGTFSDMLLGFVMSFIAPVIEIGWSLYNITWEERFRMIACFPLIYPLYVISLLLESTQLRTCIIFSAEALASNNYPILYPEVLTPSPCKVQVSTATKFSKSHISIKIVRIQVAALQNQNQLPIIEVRFQNVVTYLQESIHEGSSFRFVEPTVFFPIDQLKFDANQDLKLRIRVYNRNLITGHDDILARVTIPSDIVRIWVANGRFEGPLPFNRKNQNDILTCLETGKCEKSLDMVQIVFKRNVKKTDNIESLFHICEKGFSCKATQFKKTYVPPPTAHPIQHVCPSPTIVRQPTMSASEEAKYASDMCIKIRKSESIFSHAEMEHIFELEEDLFDLDEEEEEKNNNNGTAPVLSKLEECEDEDGDTSNVEEDEEDEDEDDFQEILGVGRSVKAPRRQSVFLNR